MEQRRCSKSHAIVNCKHRKRNVDNASWIRSRYIRRLCLRRQTVGLVKFERAKKFENDDFFRKLFVVNYSKRRNRQETLQLGKSRHSRTFWLVRISQWLHHRNSEVVICYWQIARSYKPFRYSSGSKRYRITQTIMDSRPSISDFNIARHNIIAYTL